jgi:glutamyl-tRNA synthetase
MNPAKTRFAPSPTGLIHLGNARTALFSKLHGARFLLRIEDSDRERSREEFVAALMEDLRWLGLEWDEGPADAVPEPEYHQSRREAVYSEYYRRLEEAGRAYPCFCTAAELEISRKVQLASGRPPRYSGPCARLSAADAARLRQEGRAATLRFRVPADESVQFVDAVRGAQSFATNDIGDFIIRRADGSAAFFFCNAIDDALMGVNWVLRGEDHLSNTPRQLLILKALGLPVPEYGHLALIHGDDGAPLSKRNGSRSIRELREEGYLPLAVINLLARLGHHYEEDGLLDLTGLSQSFRLERLGKAPARFDPVQLNHWQEATVHATPDDVLWDWLHEDTRILVPLEKRHAFLDIVRSNCRFPRDGHRWAAILFNDDLERDAEITAIADAAGEDFFRAAFDAAETAHLEPAAFLERIKSATGAKGKALFQPLRAALTGCLDGPEIGKICALMEPHRLRMRLAEFMAESE